MRCFFHKYVSVADIDHSICDKCFRGPDTLDSMLLSVYPKGWCPHFIMVCKTCGALISTKLTNIPDSCKFKRENDKNT